MLHLILILQIPLAYTASASGSASQVIEKKHFSFLIFFPRQNSAGVAVVGVFKTIAARAS